MRMFKKIMLVCIFTKAEAWVARTSGEDETRERFSKNTIVEGGRKQDGKTEEEMGRSDKERPTDVWT